MVVPHCPGKAGPCKQPQLGKLADGHHTQLPGHLECRATMLSRGCLPALYNCQLATQHSTVPNTQCVPDTPALAPQVAPQCQNTHQQHTVLTYVWAKFVINTRSLSSPGHCQERTQHRGLRCPRPLPGKDTASPPMLPQPLDTNGRCITACLA